jgi:magnesium transporter
MAYINMVLKGGSREDPLTIIRAIKDAVKEMTFRVKGFSQSLTRILNEDEDMALMNLTRLIPHPERYIQPVSTAVLEEESDEPELILEAHLQIAMTLSNTLDLIQGQISTASELVDQKLDSIRNRLLLANMLISVFSLCVSCMSLVGSFMGMNLINYHENSPHAFKYVCYGSVGGGLLLAFVIMTVLFRTGTIPPV